VTFELPKVKVCGLTNRADVDSVQAAGADALGFVHYAPSPRHLELAQLSELSAAVSAALKVGVLVDLAVERARELIDAAQLDAVQLCGTEQPGDWSDFPVPVLRRLAVTSDAERELEAWSQVAAGYVLDHPSTPGGSGLGVEIEQASQLARRAPCLLAGGLAADNVAQRVRAVRPAGVDASSRLERAAGLKDAQHVRAFVQNATAALQRSAKEQA